ncbi:MAG: hypothetical protein U0228_00325 [Myxococcaceae bacterium]
MPKRTLKFDELPLRARRQLYSSLCEARTEKSDPRLKGFEVRTVVRGFWKPLLVLGLIGVALTLREIISRVREYHIGSDPVTFMLLAAAATLVIGALATALVMRRWPHAPWPIGRFVFPGHIIEAGEGWLDVTPTLDLDKPTLVTVKRNGQYSLSRIDFAPGVDLSFVNHERATKVCEAWVIAREEWRAAITAGGLDAAERLDPLAECAVSGQWTVSGGASGDAPSVPARPKVLRAVWAASLVVGIAVSAGVYAWVEQATRT